MRPRLLIPGGKGQVGSLVAHNGPDFGFEIFAPGANELDITNKQMVSHTITQYRPDIIINCAAYTGVDKAESEPDLAHRVNADGPRWLAEASAPDTPILHISTDYVFDGTGQAPYREDQPPNPRSVYGHSKLAGEQALLGHHPQSLVLRTAWVYGTSHANFLKTMLRLAASRDEISVVDDQFGCPTHAADIARALLEIARQIVRQDTPPDWPGLYHYCGAGQTTWHGFAKLIFDEYTRRTGKPLELHAITTAQYPTPAERPRWSVLDCQKINRKFGITPDNWQKAVRASVQQVLEQERD